MTHPRRSLASTLPLLVCIVAVLLLGPAQMSLQLQTTPSAVAAAGVGVRLDTADLHTYRAGHNPFKAIGGWIGRNIRAIAGSVVAGIGGYLGIVTFAPLMAEGIGYLAMGVGFLTAMGPALVAGAFIAAIIGAGFYLIGKNSEKKTHAPPLQHEPFFPPQP